MYEILCYCHLIEKSYLLNKDNMKSKTNYPLDKHLFKVSNASRAMSMVVFLVSLPLILKRYLLIGSSPYFKWIPARPKASVSKIILKKVVLMKFGEVFGEHAWSRPYLIKLQTKYLYTSWKRKQRCMFSEELWELTFIYELTKHASFSLNYSLIFPTRKLRPDR